MSDDPTVEVLERTEVYGDKFLKMARAKVRYRQSNGQMSDPMTRLAINHGNAVGVLVYDPTAQTVVLVRQFRYAIYDRLPEEAKAQSPEQAWLLEIVAGIEEHGQSAEETARRELREEAGYEVSGALERIASVYTTPGTDGERITLFLAEVDTASQQSGGGGLAEEGEDTALVTLSLADALAMLDRGEVRDAKTLIALQYLAGRLAGAGGSSA